MTANSRKDLKALYGKTVIRFIKMMLKRSGDYSWYAWQRRVSSCWSPYSKFFDQRTNRGYYNILGFRTIDPKLLLILELRVYYDDVGEEIEFSSELKEREYVLELRVIEELGRYRKRKILEADFAKEEDGAKLLFRLLKNAEKNATFVQKDRVCFFDDVQTLRGIMKEMGNVLNVPV